MRVDILDVGFDSMTMSQAVIFIRKIIEKGEKGYIVTPNPEIVWLCRENPALKKAVDGAALVAADGVGITIAAKILKTPLPQRIPGIDLATRLFAEFSAGTSLRVFLLGASPGVAEAAAANLSKRYPGIVIAGTADGYFTEDTPIIERINDAKPDLLLVCMGAPKQELWMAANLEKLDVRVCMGLGGALDVFAGTVKRAPPFMRRLGLEWLYRLIREPRRIKRMIILPVFIFAVFRARIKGIMAQRGFL